MLRGEILVNLLQEIEHLSLPVVRSSVPKDQQLLTGTASLQVAEEKDGEMRVGSRIGTQQELTTEDIECPVIGLPFMDVVDGDLDTHFLPTPDITTGITP